MQLVAIVDDDQAGRESVKDLLDHVGLSTAAFASAESVLQSGQLHNVACLFTDLCVPGMSGLELPLRLMASNLRIPAILVTGCNDSSLPGSLLPLTGASDGGLACPPLFFTVEPPLMRNEMPRFAPLRMQHSPLA
jgi:CheY-like chemotaxis protein